MLKPSRTIRADVRNETMEKDETELELEKLVFGDDAGFHDSLRDFKASNVLNVIREKSSDAQDANEDKDEDELERVKDSDVGRWEIMVI